VYVCQHTHTMTKTLYAVTHSHAVWCVLGVFAWVILQHSELHMLVVLFRSQHVKAELFRLDFVNLQKLRFDMCSSGQDQKHTRAAVLQNNLRQHTPNTRHIVYSTRA
jgi:hypothetical protein